MIVLRLLPVILSFLLLAAHFSRADIFPLIVACIAAPFLLFVRRPWVAKTFQVLLVIGALEWVRTLIAIARRRQLMGEPWTRMAIILGVVAAVTLASALVFRTRAMKDRYHISPT